MLRLSSRILQNRTMMVAPASQRWDFVGKEKAFTAKRTQTKASIAQFISFMNFEDFDTRKLIEILEIK